MPPPSPAPGWASGEVCTLSIAIRLTDIRTRSLLFAFRRAGRSAVGVLVLERLIDLHERLLLSVAERFVPQDRLHQIVMTVAGLEDARPHVERLRRDPQRSGD